MTHYDLFNGDADGIAALIQLRLAEPLDSQLITGVKRDTNLLRKVTATEEDIITVLDISLDKNRSALDQVLAAGASVFYIDHHFTGEIPDSKRLKTIINTNADVCTSILVNQHLNNRYIEWAIVGAFGDNLKNSARNLCKNTQLTESEINDLENLGIYINYNGYGATLDDLHFTPSDLYQRLRPFENPLLFINNAKQDFDKLEMGYHTDMSAASALNTEYESDNIAVYILPNESWARRVSGVFGNNLANQYPNRAHAVLTEKDNSDFLVSIRAPLRNKTGADEFCRQFATGGGRAAAAGINNLPVQELNKFIHLLDEFY